MCTQKCVHMETMRTIVCTCIIGAPNSIAKYMCFMYVFARSNYLTVVSWYNSTRCSCTRTTLL